jgi:hypothetical protein
MHNKTKYPESNKGDTKRIMANRRAALAMATPPKGKKPKRKITRSK